MAQEQASASASCPEQGSAESPRRVTCATRWPRDPAGACHSNSAPCPPGICIASRPMGTGMERMAPGPRRWSRPLPGTGERGCSPWPADKDDACLPPLLRLLAGVCSQVSGRALPYAPGGYRPRDTARRGGHGGPTHGPAAHARRRVALAPGPGGDPYRGQVRTVPGSGLDSYPNFSSDSDSPIGCREPPYIRPA